MKRIVIAVFMMMSAGLIAESANTGSPRTIEVHARRYSFQPSEISVKKGETVMLKLISDDVPHSLQVKELGIDEAASKKKPGQGTFTAANTGTFHGKCGRFCGEGHGKMTFTIRVSGN